MIRDKLEKFIFGKYRNKTIMWVMNNDPHFINKKQKNGIN